MNKLIYLWLAVKTVFCTCQTDHRINHFKKIRSHYKINKIGKLPTVVSESSGLARSQTIGSFWTHNDSGGKTELYEVDFSGNLLLTKSVPEATNTDWEDLAQDDRGAIYVGDIGTNAIKRNIYQIYKIDEEGSDCQKITFSYTDQKELAPATVKQNFDCESMFYHQESLYLFSKTFNKKQYVKLYRLPAKTGAYTISAIDSIRINAPVTSSDVSPDGKKFALLTYGKVLLFEVVSGEINFKRPLGCFRMVRKQAEAIVFLNNADMLVTNEQGGIYKITQR